MGYEEYKRKALEPIVNYIESVMASYSKEELEARIKKALPEKEAEDERIRTRLIALVEAFGQGAYKNEMLTYLEKQKERKVKTDACGFPLREQGESACSYLERCLAPDMRHIWYEACAEIKEKQKEQNIYKSSKSEIDFADRYSKDVWEKLMTKFLAIEGYSIGCNDVSDIVLNAILNAFKWQKEQKPAEWSEEDEDTIEKAICVLEANFEPKEEFSELDINRYQLVKRLKSLRPRLHWKPSEEQMEWLESAVRLSTNKPHIHGIIISLYEQLKRL